MIVIPITANNVIESFEEIRKAAKVADIIELRSDYLFTANRIILRKLLRFVRSCKKPVIVTPRDRKQGGAGIIDNNTKIELILESIKQKADYFDIEADKLKLLKKVDVNDIRKELEDDYGVDIKKFDKDMMKTRFIVSYHNFKKTPDVISVYKKIRRDAKKYKLKNYVVKIVTLANTIEDNAKIFKLLELAKKDKQAIAAFCMGNHGEISRVLSAKYGSLFTFGSLEETKMTAPGQINAELLKNIYRVNKQDAATKVFGLIGKPVNESKGYLVHNLCFENKKINAVYVNFLVDDLKKFLAVYKDRFNGFSITMPYKQSIVKYLNKEEQNAKMIGAVNTAAINGGKLSGYNTDYNGALEALIKATKLADKKVLIIGAGGVAKAILAALINEGAIVTIADSDEHKARSVANAFNAEYCTIKEIADVEFDILINATPIGMAPNTDAMPVSNEILDKLDKKKVVFDVVYSPEKTKLLEEAEKRHAIIVSGVDMFILQAREQFRIFTGKQPDLRLMKRILVKGALK